MDEGWINGGFFVVSEKFLSFIKNDKTYLEREPLEKVTKLKQLSAYRHNGFWQCIDNMRDLISINKKIKEKKITL
jgi:glucose-1-phosphate cytidylyltransferase